MRPVLLPVENVAGRSRQVAVQVLLMPVTVDTALWAPDGGRKYHPKHVEPFTDINILYIFVSCWIFISIIEHKSCLLMFSTKLSETFLILRITERDMIKIYNRLHVKCPLFLCDFNNAPIFSTEFRGTLIYIYIYIYIYAHTNFAKSRPVWAELFHAEDGETNGHDELFERS